MISPGRFLRIRDVEHETALSRTTIYRRIKAETFPPPRPIGGGSVRWTEADIEAWKARALTDA